MAKPYKPKFAVGQKIICVVASRDLKAGDVYTVQDYDSTIFANRPLVNIVEIPLRTGYYEYRFRSHP